MLVDTYKSKSRPGYGVVVEAGRELEGFSDEIQAGIEKLKPLEPHKKRIELDDLCKGELLEYHQKELASKGVSLQKIVTRFDEL